MTRLGTIASGCFDVHICGKPAARKSDLTTHGGMIVEGCSTVVIGGPGLVAARVIDMLSCPASDGGPHLGGMIMPSGCVNVFIGGRIAARIDDLTLCTSPPGMAGGGYGSGDGGDGDADHECAHLWAQYDAEAESMVRPFDDDPIERNKVITGAYADLYLRNPNFQWAGLAAYASKEVGCAMNHSDNLRKGALPTIVTPVGPVGMGVAAAANHTFNSLAIGNRNLFVDIYPVHRFYEEQGWGMLEKCAGSRQPPLTAPALDGFRAIHLAETTGDKSYLEDSVVGMAQHEQIGVLQRDVYNDPYMRRILDANEEQFGSMHLPLTYPAKVVFGSGCSAKPGETEMPFSKSGRDDLYDVPQRMEWILDEIGSEYFRTVGTTKHRDDLGELRRTGTGAGANYPKSGAPTP